MEHMVSSDRASAVLAEPTATYDVRGGGGVRLHAREWGNRQGRAVVFIHGWSASHMCWAHQMQGRLADDFRLVAFDNRGHGMSEKPLGADSYRDPQLWADDLAAVIDQLGLDRPVLVAWSYGGFIVSDYIRAYGEDRIGAINLVGAAVMLKPPTFDHIGPGFLENAPDASMPDLATNIAAVRRFLGVCTAEPLEPDDWSAALAWNMVVPPEVRGALISREIDSDDVLSALSVPVLVTHGMSDTIVLPSMGEHVLNVCKPARPSRYEGIGHMPFTEAQPRFDHELAELAADVA
ncbi:alpha/beta fold hydrolase [Kribbella sp. NBC_00889]|uniref:alpha/beta fold hydrolase n=1 Tax=Kribbella sp. NBC_00889 TaxID=2975974 RepID=UPI003864A0FB|nr:alpha/beta hydrolase [Kribbella sp. NBC_00889]